MRGHYLAWSGALTVMAVTVVLVILDVTVGPVQRFWSRHSFSSSVLAGLLVLLLTVLIVDRVARIRQLRRHSHAIAVQAAIIVAQSRLTADAIVDASLSADDRGAAQDELRTYTQMLFTSVPVLIDAAATLAFLETAQRTAGQLNGALREARAENTKDTKVRLDAAIDQLRRAAAPLVETLNREQLAAAFGPDEIEKG
jgi:pyridoxine 5'-phosphate synthase PdxJ